MNDDFMEHSSNRALQTLADAYAALNAGRLAKDGALEAAGTVAQCADSLPQDLQLPLRYHQARLLAVGEQTDQALQVLHNLDGVSVCLPEAVWLTVQLVSLKDSAETAQVRWTLEDRLGSVLPLSPWGGLLNSRLEQREADKLGQPLFDSRVHPVIPSLDAQKLLRIASLYDQMAMSTEAANAYREAIYSAVTPPGFPETGANTWISDSLAPAWLTIAKYEASSGNKLWAAQAVFMAVASSSRVRAAASGLLRSIEAGEKPLVQPKPDAQTLIEIAGLYRACNLHPRAIQALDKAAELPEGNVSSLKDEIASEWSQRIASYKSGRDQTCFLFGFKVASTSPEKLLPLQFPCDRR